MEQHSQYTTCTPVSVTAAWLIWFLISLFYFYEYFLRSAPSVMEQELLQVFNLDKAGLGSLIGAYYYTYAPMQIIAGITLDRFGGRKVVPFAVLLCSIGSWFFTSSNIYFAILGRMLIGAGSGFAFVSVIFIATNWISRKHLALLTGLTQALGMLGAILGQLFVVKILKTQSWETPWIYSCYVGFALAVLLYLIIPKRAQHIQLKLRKAGMSKAVKNLKIVFLNSQTWLAAIFAGCIFLPTTIFAMIWAIPFFEKAFYFSTYQSTTLISFIFLGWMLGSPGMGFVSDRINNRKGVMLFGLIAVFISYFCILWITSLNYMVLCLLIFLTGFFSGVELVTIAHICEVNPSSVKGAAIGIANFIVFILSAMLSPLLGFLLDWFSRTTLNSVIQYQLTLSIISFFLFIAFFCCFWIKESKIESEFITMEREKI